jgi:hypothetical protein
VARNLSQPGPGRVAARRRARTSRRHRVGPGIGAAPLQPPAAAAPGRRAARRAAERTGPGRRAWSDSDLDSAGPGLRDLRVRPGGAAAAAAVPGPAQCQVRRCGPGPDSAVRLGSESDRARPPDGHRPRRLDGPSPSRPESRPGGRGVPVTVVGPARRRRRAPRVTVTVARPDSARSHRVTA